MIQEIDNIKNFNPFPTYSRREAWNNIPENRRNYFLQEAARLKKASWSCLSASLYLDFHRSGNRTRYEDLYFGRRRTLLIFMLAECIQGKGEFIDSIIDVIWLIAEESTWIVPAHLHHLPDRQDAPAAFKTRELPYPADLPFIDLFSAETASLFSWVYYFLGDIIGEHSPAVKARMEHEIKNRILSPYLQYDNFWWMGFNLERPVNNWNPWINSNVLVAFLVFSTVFKEYQEGVNKAIRSINRFIHGYAEDGGCDEGPSYFNAAGASLFDFIEELEHVTNVSYLYRQSKLKNMAAYIYKVHIAGNYFVNYADAPPEVIVPAGMLKRIAAKNGDATLCGFAEQMLEKNLTDDFKLDRLYFLHRIITDIFASPPAPKEKTALNVSRTNWFPGIQVVTSRDYGSKEDGFFFSAKGGTNDESHNHNDIGNFILYYNGVPVIIDAGVENYTKFTFSSKRYDIWTMQSGYHNVPAINNVDQRNGLDHCASDVSFSEENNTVKFALDIAGAYPESAGIKSYRREFIFRQAEGLLITDKWLFAEKGNTVPVEQSLSINLLCHQRPKETGKGFLLSEKVMLEYAILDSSEFAFDHTQLKEIDEIPLTDSKLLNNWRQKGCLYRLRLTFKTTKTSGTIKLRLSSAEKVPLH